MLKILHQGKTQVAFGFEQSIAINRVTNPIRNIGITNLSYKSLLINNLNFRRQVLGLYHQHLG